MVRPHWMKDDFQFFFFQKHDGGIYPGVISWITSIFPVSDEGVTYRPTDGPTDPRTHGPTDSSGYEDARRPMTYDYKEDIL